MLLTDLKCDEDKKIQSDMRNQDKFRQDNIQTVWL